MPAVTSDTVRRLLLGANDAEIRYRFVQTYSDQLENFVDQMVSAFSAWEHLDNRLTKDEPSAHVTALVYGALHTHVIAMKLLLEGLLVPSGNSQRYVLESIAMAFLISKPSLGYLDRYLRSRYSTSNATRDLARHAKILGLNRDAITSLGQWKKFYDRYSHPTHLTLGSLMTFNAEDSQTVLGGHFDSGKAFAYEKEINSRISLASTFQNFIDGVTRNYTD